MKTQSVISLISRLLLASAFIISGFLKLYPIEFFENDLLMHHLGNESLVLFESRLLIASEFIIGAGILLALHDKLFLSLSYASLALYTIYLFAILAIEGNAGNCGCMGSAIVLSPLEGIIKNVFLFSLTYWVWQISFKWSTRYRSRILLSLCAIGIAAPFIFNPILLPEKIITTSGERTVLPLELLYETPGETPPSFNLVKGKKIVAFLLLSCSHCKLAATRLEAIKRSNPELPIHLLLCGERDDLAKFLRETNVSVLPYSYYSSLHFFMKMSGPDFPAIYLVNDKVADAKMGFYEINSEALNAWFADTTTAISRD